MRLTSADGGTDVITIGEQRAGRAGWASRAGRDGRPQVAVVGAGVAGLTAAYLLQQAYDVTLYEAEDRLGGHAHTHDIATRGRPPAAPGHRVHRAQRAHLPEPHPAVRRARGHHQGHRDELVRALRGLRPRVRRLPRPAGAVPGGRFPGPARSTWRCWPPSRASTATRRRLLASSRRGRRSRWGSSCGGADTGRYFIAHFAVPLVSAVWSCPPADALEYPARYLFEFLDHHGMLRVARTSAWRTVTGGSRTYVEQHRQATHAASRPACRCGPSGARPAGWTSTTTYGGQPPLRPRPWSPPIRIRHCACWTRPPPPKRDILGTFRYTSSQVVLHTDDRSPAPGPGGPRVLELPARAAARAPPANVAVSYYLNRLQGLDRADPLPGHAERARPGAAASRVLRRMTYRHPLYTSDPSRPSGGCPASTLRCIAYAGAYHGWGFHEDGCRSGIDAAALARGRLVSGSRALPLRDHPCPDPPGPAGLHLPQLPVAGRSRRPAAAAAGAAPARQIPGPAITLAARPAITCPARARCVPAWTPIWAAMASASPAGGCSCSVSARVLGHVFNPLTRVLVPRRRRQPGGGPRRGAQHLWRAARVPAAPGRPRAGGGGQGLLRLTVPAGRRRATGCGCRCRAAACGSASPWTSSGRPVLAAGVTGKHRAVHPVAPARLRPPAIPSSPAR